MTTNFDLNLPLDIPWERICVSRDMMEARACNAIRVAGITFKLGQPIQQFAHELLLLWGHSGSPRI